jgi:hypothetical protein
MTRFVSAGAGFLLAVLWFDLMFDVQVARHRLGELPEAVLASITGYYRRVTTAARPMNRLVAAAMVATLGTIIAQIARGEHPRWLGWVSLALAGAHTVPSAVRLGTRRDPAERQAQLARAVFRDHVLCAVSIMALLVVQLTAG